MVAVIIAIFSALVALASAFYAWRSARAAEATAQIARDQDRRARAPKLRIWLADQASASDTSVIYHVVNQGPDDLRSIVIHKPETPDGISHPVAAVGAEWADVARLGDLRLGAEKQFVLSIGTSSDDAVEPAYRVRIVTSRGGDAWEQIQELEVPRHPLGIY